MLSDQLALPKSGCDYSRIHCKDDWEKCHYDISGRDTACIGSCFENVFCRPFEEYAKVEMDCHDEMERETRCGSCGAKRLHFKRLGIM